MSAQHAAWQIDSKALAEFLGTKRWFGEKGREVHDAELTTLIPVHWAGARKEYAVARATVHTEHSASVYQLFLVQGDELSDALEDDVFRRGLADAFVKGAAFEADNARWIIESESATPLVVPAKALVMLASSEQSNSSVIIDGEAILKLFRKLEAGVHPDVEVTRFLTIEREFVYVPALLGTIRFEDDAGVTTAGMLQELVPGAVDGWTYALGCAREYFDREGPSDAPLPFEEPSRQLGVVTRALHETLASGDPDSDFAWHAATSEDVTRWVSNATEMIERAVAALARAIGDTRLPRDVVAEAQTLVERRPRYLQWLTELADGIGSDAGGNTRTHGDYHLGQVLRSAAAQFLVIDFEGEPARPLSHRRARQSPLRDVAGMLRSFAYAAAVAVRESEGGEVAAARGSRWERAMREAFLRGYFSEGEGKATILPRSESNAERLLSLFEAEKAFYELQYELDHRPDWVWIPLRGIAGLYT